MTGAGTIELPRGRWFAGKSHREAELRPPAGSEATRLFDELEGLTAAEWTTALLARCLARLGPPGEVTPGEVRSLSVGDREALLLHLCRRWSGERLECVVGCPRCGERLDVEVDVADLLLPPYDEAPARHEMAFAEAGEEWTVRFRLPTGGDQEAACRVGGSPGAAVRLILERCLEGVWRGGERLDWIPEPVAAAVPDAMAKLDPQAELLLRLDCAACEQPFRAALDMAGFLARTTAARRTELEHEVHVLALHYHWSEAEILALGASRRRRYLDLLGEPAAAGAFA
jgi:hypothetical protein